MFASQKSAEVDSSPRWDATDTTPKGRKYWTPWRPLSIIENGCVDPAHFGE